MKKIKKLLPAYVALAAAGFVGSIVFVVVIAVWSQWLRDIWSFSDAAV